MPLGLQPRVFKLDAELFYLKPHHFNLHLFQQRVLPAAVDADPRDDRGRSRA
jgi:hypothetical protein